MVPGAGRVDGWVFEDVVDSFVAESFEACPVLGKDEGFGEAGEGCCGFEDYEVVDVLVELVQSDLKPVEFCVDHHQIIYLPPSVSVWEGLPVVCGAVS